MDHKERQQLKELDCVEVIVEKKKYTEEGVHKGMQGWVVFDECVNGFWLINFPRYGEKDDIATPAMRREDLRLIDRMDARVNEEIERQIAAGEWNAETLDEDSTD